MSPDTANRNKPPYRCIYVPVLSETEGIVWQCTLLVGVVVFWAPTSRVNGHAARNLPGMGERDTLARVATR